MEIKDAVVIAAAVIAGIAALTVPFLTYRFASRHEHRKWLREQRMQAYVELLTALDSIKKSVTASSTWEGCLDRLHATAHFTSENRFVILASPLVLAIYSIWMDEALLGATGSDAERIARCVKATEAARGRLATAMRDEMGSVWIPNLPLRFMLLHPFARS